MAREKRTKPCLNCKRSKVKCIYTENLPCERCLKTSQSSTCTFVPKLPNLRLPVIGDTQSFPRQEVILPPFNPISLKQPGPSSGSTTPVLPDPVQPHPRQTHHEQPNSRWRDEMENKMESFDSKLDSLVDVLRANQQLLRQQQEQTEELQKERQRRSEELYKRHKPSDDFRNDVITLEEAKELFRFFDTNITPQLFGFEISKISVDNIWISSPILVCAIGTIASMHHPTLSSKLTPLLYHLHSLCSNLVYQGSPTSEVEGFNTILALIFCSFWLSDSQMFTGLALQMAKEIGLDKRTPNPSMKPGLNPNDRLKLWYLLYILDGQQSLTYSRQPLVNSSDYSLEHSRSLLLTNDKALEDPTEPEKEAQEAPPKQEDAPRFTDLRLVSQVEYNQALKEVFKGNAWDLLTPSTFGIPSKSNLELDKWMVSWTVLLSPMNNGSVWSSKSTLIYYNFAKMHINSIAVRSLQSKNEFPKLDQFTASFPQPPPRKKSPPESKDWEESSDEEDEEEFILNTQLVSADETVINAGIALNAAQNVLNLVVNDKDIMNNLKYVPVHVHIMLYYASMLLVENRAIQSSETTEDELKSMITNLGLVFTLRKIIDNNFPVDKHFGTRLITSLEELIFERSNKLKGIISESDVSKEIKDKLLQQLSQSNLNSDKFEPFEASSRSSSPGSIYAWPGSNHGHPSQTEAT